MGILEPEQAGLALASEHKVILSFYVCWTGFHIHLQGDDGNDCLLLNSVFQQVSLKEKFSAAGWHAPSWAHSRDNVDRTLPVCEDVLKNLAAWIGESTLSAALNGHQVQLVFRAP